MWGNMQNPLLNGCGMILDPSRIRTLRACYWFFICLFFKFGAGFVRGSFAAVAAPPTPPEPLSLPAAAVPEPAPASRQRPHPGPAALRRRPRVPVPTGPGATGSCLCPSAQPGSAPPRLRPSCLGFRLISPLPKAILVVLGEPKPFKVKSRDGNKCLHLLTYNKHDFFLLGWEE